MPVSELLFALFSLIFVISLIGLCAFLIKRFALEKNFSIGSGKERRLKILEHLPLDTRRRLMIIEKDGKEEILLMLGVTEETVISTTAVKKKNNLLNP